MPGSATEHATELNGFSSNDRLDGVLEENGLRVTDDDGGPLVDWKSNAEDRPTNWSSKPTIHTLVVVLLWSMFTTILTTIGTAASVPARQDFRLSQQVGYLIFTTSTLLGEGIGGALFAPISESFGRRTVYLFGSVLATISCGISAIPHPASVTIGRFLTGFACAIPPSISGGIIDDIFHDSPWLTWNIYIWTTVSNAGLSVGPIVSGYLTFRVGWQWPFYVATIAAFVLTLLSAAMRESRPSLLLKRKAQHVERVSNTTSIPTRGHDSFPTLSGFVRQALVRPLRLLFTEPIIAVSAVIAATIFGLAYGLTAGLEVIYIQYGFSEAATSLSFIPILLGMLLATAPRVYDDWRSRQARKSGAQPDTEPEAKLWSFGVAVPVFAIGLWLVAWTIKPKVSIHWIVSMVGLVLFGYALNDINFVLAGYVTESYGSYAASAYSGIVMARAAISCGFAQGTEPFFVALGPNIAVSILAAVATLFCLAPVLFMRYGKKLRSRSRFASSLKDSDDKS